ncbi:NADH:ubiquinone oxidoreductase [Alistipes sp. ZOR0009]|uniref:NADH-quinone oxidoreductase subunit B family protein n=1 Tax=Alistipes sp. ZOR0009 TaxID=1339253 RepID=UPI000645C66C|nr:NADH:ubiquinone oxidoreductase [Alistipes sp. ZOR0009]
MINEIKILHDHGIQYVKDLRNAILTPLFRGRPIISGSVTEADAASLEAMCPSGAITAVPLTLDLGKCVFCRECEFAFPHAVRFTNDYHIAASRREDLVVRAGEDRPITVDTTLLRKKVRKLLGPSLKLRQVSAAGDNSCEMELNASGNVNFDMGRMGIEFVASPRHADGIVITGPISKNMAEALQICYEATPEPKIVVLVGSDAISGGLYANSPALDRSFLERYHVDLYVPGNPAHPLTFINGLMDLLGIEDRK